MAHPAYKTEERELLQRVRQKLARYRSLDGEIEVALLPGGSALVRVDVGQFYAVLADGQVEETELTTWPLVIDGRSLDTVRG